jgi:release factor glutamine methyltransferase
VADPSGAEPTHAEASDGEAGDARASGPLAAVVGTLRAAGCVFAEEEASRLVEAAPDADRLAAMLQQRVAGLPLEHIVGWAEFCGLRIAVDPGVFIPRRRTELLVRKAARVAAASIAAAQIAAARIAAAAPAGPGLSIVDLCCGSGAVAVAVAALVPGVSLHAADVDPAAVRCARRNLAPLGGRVYQGDLYAALPPTLRGRVGVLVANVPYVPSEAVELMPREARLHEPRVALDGGPDGLDQVRRVAAGAGQWLAPGGHVLVEAGEDQAAVAAEVFRAAGLCPSVEGDEELAATVVIGRF